MGHIVGEYLQKLRQQRGISQGDLAKALNLNTAQSISNIERVLAAAGLTLKDVVKVMSYVDSSENLAEYNRLYRELFPEPFPARTTVVNCLTGVGIKYEVDVVAYSDDK